LITNLVNRRLISLHINVINPNESKPGDLLGGGDRGERA